MTKGSLLLDARSALESQIITSFLEAADYQVADFTTWRQATDSRLTDFDAAVLVIENENTNLAETCVRVREMTQRPHLPLVMVTAQPPAHTIEGLAVLIRPIRLFDLVYTLDQVIADSHRQNPNGLQSRHTTIHV